MDTTSARLVQWLRSLPQLTVAAATMYGCGSVLLVAGVLAWEPGKNPRWVMLVLAAISMTMFAWVLVRGGRFTADEALGMTAVQLFTVGSLTWTTHLSLGAFANGTVLPIVAVFTVWFLHPVRGRLVLYAGTAWWFAAIVHQPEPSLVPFAASLVAQTLVAAEVFARVKQRMERLARTDSLTGTLNRRGIDEVLERQVVRALRRDQSLAVVAIDLDGLREVNNTQGHLAGDRLLERITRHWKAGLRRGDDVGRTGGDEFVFVLPDTTLDEARAFVQRMAATSPGAWSPGIATAEPGDTASSLLERADQLMYVTKAARRVAGVPSAVNPPSVESWIDRPTDQPPAPQSAPTAGTYDRRVSATRRSRRSAS